MTSTAQVHALPRKWRAHAQFLRTYGDEKAAIVCERHAQELEDALWHGDDEPLNLREAATLSGYTEDHLGRLVRDGKIPNSGRKHAPRIRRADLPIKPGHLPDENRNRELLGASAGQIVEAVVNSE